MQQNEPSPRQKVWPAQPRWPAALAALAVGGLYLSLPASLTFGPSWLFLAAVVVLLVPVWIARIRGSFALNQVLGLLLLGVVTAAMLWSLYLLIRSLLSHQLSPVVLLRSAAALWVTNFLVFASWYWRLDAGGPHARHLAAATPRGISSFPR